VCRAGVVVVVLVASCGRYRFDPLGDAADACAAERVELGPWSQLGAMAALNSLVEDDDPTPSDDGLELYFTSPRPGAIGKADIWRVRRNSTLLAWGPVERVVELSSVANENTPELSSDGLTMPFGSEQLIPELSSAAYDQDLRLSPDRRHAVFSSQRSGAGDCTRRFADAAATG
jgi:WD40 repeat protein